MKMIHAVLIDPTSKEVRDVEVMPTLSKMYALLQCEMIEAVTVPQMKPDMLYADENGLFDPELLPFNIKGYGQIVGKALLVGVSSMGDEISSKNKAEDISWLISFPN